MISSLMCLSRISYTYTYVIESPIVVPLYVEKNMIQKTFFEIVSFHDTKGLQDIKIKLKPFWMVVYFHWYQKWVHQIQNPPKNHPIGKNWPKVGYFVSFQMAELTAKSVKFPPYFQT